MEKRGVSAIVATVLIILITVTAVTIIWAAIIPLINNSLTFQNLEGSVSVVLSEGYTSYDASKGVASVHLKTDAGSEKLNYARIVFYFGGDSVSTIVEAPVPNAKRIYYFNLSEFGDPDSVSVASIFSDGASSKEGAASSPGKFKTGRMSLQGVSFEEVNDELIISQIQNNSNNENEVEEENETQEGQEIDEENNETNEQQNETSEVNEITNYFSVYPPSQAGAYVKVTSIYDLHYYPFFATDPSKLLTGTWVNNGWVSEREKIANQRFHIDLGEAKKVYRIYYENGHKAGLKVDSGVKDFTFWGSNDATAFGNLVYDSDAGWAQINTSGSSFVKHAESDVADPQYIDLPGNDIAYRYYAFKFSNNYGRPDYMTVRRIELQSGS